MKRFIIAYLLCVVSVSINAQTIKFRHILEPDGLSVMTTKKSVSTWGVKTLDYALQFEQSSEDNQNWGYTLHIYFIADTQDQYVPKGGKLLIRTTKDEVLNLQDCGTDHFIEYGLRVNTFDRQERTSFYFDEYAKQRFIAHGKYIITEEELQTLMSDGVIKIRIETTQDPIQCEYKPGKTNKTAEARQKLYNVLIPNIDLYYGL